MYGNLCFKIYVLNNIRVFCFDLFYENYIELMKKLEGGKFYLKKILGLYLLN